MLERLRLSVPLLLLLWCVSSPAPTLEILYRPSFGSVATTWPRGVPIPDPRTKPLEFAGHVAVRLPVGAFRDGGRIYGWMPNLDGQLPAGHPAQEMAPRQRLEYLFQTVPGTMTYRTLPGRFVEGSQWAADGTRDPLLKTMTIAIEVSDSQLETIIRNMDAMETSGKKYQFSPPPMDSYAPGAYNCVTALREIFQGTGVDLDFIPKRGDMPGLVQNLNRRASPWSPCTSFFSGF